MNREDFPTLKEGLIYLDSAATSQTPAAVIEAVGQYYRDYRASTHRGMYELARKATDRFEDVRAKTAAFLGALPEEVVFTKGATEALNLVAQRLGEKLSEGDEVVLTAMEHHANIVPWQEMAKRRGFTIRWVGLTSDYRLNMDEFTAVLSEKTKVVAVTHASNVLGTINPIQEIVRLAREVGAMVVVDAAQSAPHVKIDVKDLGCDFLAFSAHKMLGTTGVGVLYGKKERLEELEPLLYGGNMIKEVREDGSVWNDSPMKFEAGSANVAGVIGFGAALDYLQAIGMETIEARERQLTAYALGRFTALEGVKVIGPTDLSDRLGVISFEVEGIHPHDVSELLGREGVAIRGGHHCAMPLMKRLGVVGTSRASLYLYNTREDIDALIDGLKKVQEKFK